MGLKPIIRPGDYNRPKQGSVKVASLINKPKVNPGDVAGSLHRLVLAPHEIKEPKQP